MKMPKHENVPQTHKGMKKQVAAWAKSQRLKRGKRK